LHLGLFVTQTVFRDARWPSPRWSRAVAPADPVQRFWFAVSTSLIWARATGIAGPLAALSLLDSIRLSAWLVFGIALATKVITATGNETREHPLRAIALGAWGFHQKRAAACCRSRRTNVPAGNRKPPAGRRPLSRRSLLSFSEVNVRVPALRERLGGRTAFTWHPGRTRRAKRSNWLAPRPPICRSRQSLLGISRPTLYDLMQPHHIVLGA